jgi:hypothetical protein
MSPTILRMLVNQKLDKLRQNTSHAHSAAGRG